MALFLFKMAGGIFLLTIGAEFLVHASVSLARRVGMSSLVVGLTVVSVGTSMPELVVSFDAVWRGSEALGVGTVVGSNISNIALILGLAALVRPMQVKAQVVRLDVPILVAASVLLVVLVLDGRLGRLEGALLALGVVSYLAYSVWIVSRSPPLEEQGGTEGLLSQFSGFWNLGFLVVGVGGLVGGADLLVQGAVQIARVFSVPKIIIGLTVVAVGTSLPELATSVLAAYRGKGDIAIGNAIGSCILNILGILGITALVRPLSTEGLTVLDLVTLLGISVIVLPLLRSDFILSRREGSALLFVYAGYLALLFFGG